MTQKTKTLAEIRDDEARKLGWDDFKDLELTLGTSSTFELSKKASELFANQPKQDEPVSETEIMNEIRSLIDWPNVKENPSKITVETAIKLVRKFQSQQPFTITWLTDDEIQKQVNWRYTDGTGFGNNLAESVHFITGAKWLQEELQKRVNAVDPASCKHEHIERNDGLDECTDCGAKNY